MKRNCSFWATIGIACVSAPGSSRADTALYSQGVNPAPSYQHAFADILQNSPQYNDGAGTTARVGSIRHAPVGQPGFLGIGRGVLAFDLLGIPVGATIESASLTLTSREVYGNPGALNLFAVDPTENISEGTGIYPIGPDDGVTWNSASSGVPWTSGGNYLSTALSTAFQPAAGAISLPSTPEFTNVVQGAVNAGRPLQLLLRAPLAETNPGPGNSENAYYFYSDDAADPATRPILSVEFASPTSVVQLQQATATFSQDYTGDFSVARSINGTVADNLGWAIYPEVSIPQAAVFETATDVGFAGGSILSFTLTQSHANPQHTLGRFRLSITNDDRDAFADGMPVGGDTTAEWTPLRPALLASANGTTLTVLDDLSVLASGLSPGTDVYTITALTSMAGITGVRLEVIPDGSFPNGGSGRYPGYGNFVLSEFQMEVTAPDAYLWTGAGNDSLFANPANWSPSGVPGIGDAATIEGEATITGEGQPALLSITAAGRVETPGLILSDTSIVNRGSVVVAGTNALLRFANDSVDNANGQIEADGPGATVRFEPGTSLIGGTLSSRDPGAMVEIDGASVSANLVQAASGGTVILTSGLLRATTVVNSGIGPHAFDQNGGRLEVLNFLGSFEQDGGTYAPGGATAISTLSGAYILEAVATFEIELSGSDLGDFDQLFVSGNVVLNGGELSVIPLNGFQVSPGDSFGIMSVGGTLSGAFDGLNEGALVGNFAEDLFITYKAGDGNDIGLYNPLVLGGVNFADAGPDDDAFVVGDRTGSGGIPAPPVTITLESLTLLNGSSFTLDPNEILELNGGTLFIGQGAVFSGNGIIRGNVINAGLLRIPIVRLPTIPQVSGGYVEIEIPDSPLPEIVIDLPDGGGGGGFAVGVDTMISFDFEGEPTPIVLEGDPAPNEGTIRFDASLEITGSYEQRETGALRLFIAGDDLPGENYSQLIVGEEVTLAGSLEIVFDPTLFGVFDYVPMVGDTFDLIVSEGGITIAATGLNLLNFVTQDGAGLVSGVTLSPYDSGIAADPDRLQRIGETLFKLTLEENDTILRAEIIAPIEFVPEPTSAALFLPIMACGAAIRHNVRRRGPQLRTGARAKSRRLIGEASNNSDVVALVFAKSERCSGPNRCVCATPYRTEETFS